MANDFYSSSLLWGSPEKWREATETMGILIRLHRPNLNRAVGYARNIYSQMESIFSLLDDLCFSTCPWCPDPCCLVAKVWIDFQDLLFIYLNQQQLPPAQLLQDFNKPCRYLKAAGCTLPRITRPWICTRYLCPVQSANLRQKPVAVQSFFNQTVRNIKIARKEMEAEFIRVVS